MGDGGDGGAGDGGGDGGGGGGDVGFYQPSYDNLSSMYAPSESAMPASSSTDEVEELRRKIMHPAAVGALPLEGTGLSQMYQDWHYGDNGAMPTGGGVRTSNVLDDVTKSWNPYNFNGVYGDNQWGDNGAERSQNIPFGSFNQSFLNSLGYTGSDPYRSGTGLGQAMGNDSGSLESGQYKGYTPEWNNFVANKGLNFEASGGNVGDSATYLRARGADGKQVGDVYRQERDPDNEFGTTVGILASLAGGAAAGGMAAGTGAVAQGAATGAGAAFAGNLSQTADVGSAAKAGAIGGVTGGLGGAVGAVNPAGYAGIDNPTYAKAVNGAISGAGTAAATGQNPLMGAVKGGGGVLTNAGGNYITDQGGKLMDDYFGQSGGAASLGGMLGWEGDYQPPAGAGNYAGNSYQVAQNPPSYDYGSGNFNDYEPPSTNGLSFNKDGSVGSGYQAPAGAGGYGGNPYTPGPQLNMPQADKQGSGNSVMDHFKSMMQSAGQGAKESGIHFQNVGSNLMDMYSRNKQRKQQGALADNLSSMYGPNSPYAKVLEQNLSRHDAASGRRSQVGARQVELQARLAEMNSRNAPTLSKLYDNVGSARNGMLRDAYGMVAGGPNGGGLFGAGQRYLNPPSAYAPGGNVSSGFGSGAGFGNQDLAEGLADGGQPGRREPMVGTKGPVRSGGGGGLSPEVVRAAIAASAPQPGLQNMYVDPINPRSVNDYRERTQGLAFGGPVRGPGGPRDDMVPARLSNQEHVMDAHSVTALGGGNNELGQKRLNALRAKLHGRS